MKNILAALVMIFLMPACGSAQSGGAGTPQSLPLDTLVVDTGEAQHAFQVQIAATHEEKRVGLMFRADMPENEGMLFQYKYPEIVGIWMRNTYIPLDVIFIYPDGTIANIAHNMVPLSLKSKESAGFVTGVLEINGGLADELGIEPGDKIIHPFFGGDDETQ